MYPTTEALFESFSHHRPEGKLELIEGRLIVGNTIVGSRLLLQQILQGWRTDAAIALAPVETWIEALKQGFIWVAQLKEMRLKLHSMFWKPSLQSLSINRKTCLQVKVLPTIPIMEYDNTSRTACMI